MLAPAAGRLTARYGPRVPMAVGAAVAIPAAASLALLEPRSGYPALAAALLGLGTAGGLFTPPLVAAAVRAAPAARSGLAGGVNTTARQAGTAVGVAVFGSIAGSPAHEVAFVGGIHRLGLLGGALCFAALLLTVSVVESQRGHAGSETQ